MFETRDTEVKRKVHQLIELLPSAIIDLGAVTSYYQAFSGRS